jgi:hypothetical protein
MVSIDRRVHDRQKQLDHLVMCFVIYKPPNLFRSKMHKGACGVHGRGVIHVIVVVRSPVNSMNGTFFRRLVAMLIADWSRHQHLIATMHSLSCSKARAKQAGVWYSAGKSKADDAKSRKSVVETATCRLVQKQCAGMQRVFNNLVRHSRCGDSRSTIFISPGQRRGKCSVHEELCAEEL